MQSWDLYNCIHHQALKRFQQCDALKVVTNTAAACFLHDLNHLNVPEAHGIPGGVLHLPPQHIEYDSVILTTSGEGIPACQSAPDSLILLHSAHGKRCCKLAACQLWACCSIECFEMSMCMTVLESFCRWAAGKAAVAPKLDPARGPCPVRGVQQGVKGTDAQPPQGRALLRQGTLDLNGLKK